MRHDRWVQRRPALLALWLATAACGDRSVPVLVTVTGVPTESATLGFRCCMAALVADGG